MNLRPFFAPYEAGSVVTYFDGVLEVVICHVRADRAKQCNYIGTFVLGISILHGTLA